MTRTSLALVHDSSASAFDPTALRDADGEPRVRDLDLAARLGFAKPAKIRELISRNAGELATHGEVSATMAETSEDGIFPATGKNAGGPVSDCQSETRGRGRPGKEYWLNEGQALVVCALSRTSHAALERVMHSSSIVRLC